MNGSIRKSRGKVAREQGEDEKIKKKKEKTI